MDRDSALAMEMALMLQNAPNFQTVRNCLDHWEGTITLQTINVEVEIVLDEGFPNTPPIVSTRSEIVHPNLSDSNRFMLKILQEWNHTYHIHQVIAQLKGILTRSPPMEKGAARMRGYASAPVQQARQIAAESSPNADQQFTVITQLTKEIEAVSNQIQVERENLLRRVQKPGESTEAGLGFIVDPRDDNVAEQKAIKDLLDDIHVRMSDGEFDAGEYLPIYKGKMKQLYLLEKELIRWQQEGNSVSRRDRTTKDRDALEADLYALVATMEELYKSYERGDFNAKRYHLTLRARVRDAFEVMKKLETFKFDVNKFVAENKLQEKFPHGSAKLTFTESPEEYIALVTPADLGTVSDITASMIELADALRLQSIATVDLIVGILDEIIGDMSRFKKMPADYWVLNEIREWRKSIEKQDLKSLLDPEDLKKMEFQSVRWLKDFRRLLKE